MTRAQHGLYHFCCYMELHRVGIRTSRVTQSESSGATRRPPTSTLTWYGATKPAGIATRRCMRPIALPVTLYLTNDLPHKRFHDHVRGERTLVRVVPVPPTIAWVEGCPDHSTVLVIALAACLDATNRQELKRGPLSWYAEGAHLQRRQPVARDIVRATDFQPMLAATALGQHCAGHGCLSPASRSSEIVSSAGPCRRILLVKGRGILCACTKVDDGRSAALACRKPGPV